MSKLVAGDFDGERFWQDKNIVQIPSMRSSENERIVMAMDELQFLFATKDDYLFTRFQMNDIHNNYLHKIGFKFKDISCKDNSGSDYDKSVYCFLNKERFSKNELEGLELDPFEVQEDALLLKKNLNLAGEFPKTEIVKKVNSKVYSSIMRERIGCKNIAKFAKSSNEIEMLLSENINKGQTILLKDEYGVSGKGNLLLKTDFICRHILKQVQSQENKGMKVNFIIEPFLKKKEDFSCQFHIDEKGVFKFISLQKIWNSGLTYKGSISPDSSFLNFLDKNRYFHKIEDIAKLMYHDGYIGHVCVDSMILENTEIVDIVEINARKSMSLIKHYCDIFLQKYSLKGMFTSIDFIGSTETIDYEEFLYDLDVAGLLFTPNHRQGIIPLSERAMFINKNNDKPYRGRIYFVCCSNKINEIDSLLSKFKESLIAGNFKLV